MSLITDIEPLKAMEMYFGGEESGFWEGEFIKCEKQRGLIYPPKLKEFLLRFGYLRVNQNIVTFWLPDRVPTVNVTFDEAQRQMLVFGEWEHVGIGIFADECGMDDPPVTFVRAEQEDEESFLNLSQTSLHLNDILKYAFAENLSSCSDGSFYTDEPEIDTAVSFYSAKDYKGEKSFLQLMTTDKKPCAYICFDEEEDKFVCIEQDKNNDFIYVFSHFIATEELEGLFKKEFYENSLHCDFEHALSLAEKIISRYEQEQQGQQENGKSDPLKLGEMYRLAGRCCWALKQWEKAEQWLQKAEPIYTSKAVTPEAAQSYYQGLGHFYRDFGNEEKSAAAYEKADSLAKASGKDGGRLKGDRLLKMGIELSEKDCLEEAIECFEKALAEYKKDPKECKYDIARCGQLKGDARHKLKERKKEA